uniref:Uncharacterized protein n=1 Tax=Arundo donax TaxID=35708 RepID=A0A0A9EMN5_ARUDO
MCLEPHHRHSFEVVRGYSYPLLAWNAVEVEVILTAYAPELWVSTIKNRELQFKMMSKICRSLRTNTDIIRGVARVGKFRCTCDRRWHEGCDNPASQPPVMVVVVVASRPVAQVLSR